MGLKEVLSKMKIVELDVPLPGPATGGPHPAAGTPPIAGVAGAAPAGRPSRPADVREILGTLPPPPKIDESVLPHQTGVGVGEIPDFAAIYRAAGIPDPPHGYTAHKVAEILTSESFAGLDQKARAAALAGFLKMNPSGPVPIGDVIQDAVRRDQALDKFDEMLRGKLAARAREVEEENARLQAEIDELARRHREKMEANHKALEAEQARLGQWQVRKRIEERQLFEAVAPFVEQNPVSVAETPGAAGRAPSPEPREGEAGSDR